MHAVQVKEFGTSDVLEYLNLEVPSVSTNEVLIKQEAIGVNFIDIYQRSGAYEVKLPFIPGSEGAGVVSDIGKGVSHFKIGDRVAYSMFPGGYAEYCVCSRWNRFFYCCCLFTTGDDCSLLSVFDICFTTSTIVFNSCRSGRGRSYLDPNG